MSKSLKDRFVELQAERDRSWSAEQLARNAAQRRLLVAQHDPAKLPQVGDEIAPFTLRDEHGEELTRDALLAQGPVVLIFFRFGGCPACNVALPYYNETLWPELQARGAGLVALSAQIPVDKSMIQRHNIGFPVASDPDYALARSLGITFFPEDQPAVRPDENWIGATLGTFSYEIDLPAALVLDSDGRVLLLDASPDWLNRTESATILTALSKSAGISDRPSTAILTD
ncbi:peroxiredoxin [Novosphingobium sp. PhB165]|uniref:peroxiredoxin-like family protein n=1 Tax=Novosphingobium sp. PhB165 TaxID=2485105 RepID=UPI001042D92A|nr:peroxiredoxin-like family protein [Novosphingobium sp. PhB165]TCM14185.1 peroxiredoxin [Novosphingobium sp. PhB165]